MSLIMGQIESEHPELFALEFGNVAESNCLHPSNCKCRPISTKHGLNVCYCKILKAFNY